MDDTSVKRLAPTKKTLIRLFAISGNKCAFSNCEHKIFDEDGDLIAQVCHIEAASEGGERFNPNQTNEDRRQYENLVLFCYQHHVKTNDVNIYTVDVLKEIKRKHESKQTRIDVNDQQAQKLYEEGIKKVEQELRKINTKVDSIKRDTSSIKYELKKINEIFINRNEKEINEDIKAILKERERNKQESVIDSLLNIRQNKWSKLTNEQKYKVLANIGICYLDINEEENSAADYLIDALEYSPKNPKAIAFAALGHSLKGNKIDAEKLIRKAIEIDKELYNAYLALIILHKKDWSINQLLENIPKEVQTNPTIAYGIAMFIRHNDDFETAINWYQVALDNSAKERQFDIKAGFAATILESLGQPINLFLDELSSDIKNKIRYAIQLLDEAWNEIKNTDLRFSRIAFLENRAVAKKFLKDFSGAYDDLKQAFSISEENTGLSIRIAICALENDKADEALKIIEMAKGTNDYSDHLDNGMIDFIKAEALSRLNNITDAEKRLVYILNNHNNIELKIDAATLLVNIYISTGELEKARNISNEIIRDYPDNVRTYINAAKHEDNEKSIELLKTAFEKVTTETTYIDLYNLSQITYKFELYEIAISCIERLITKDSYSTLSEMLIDSYFKLGRDEEALNLCQNIQEKFGPLRVIVEVQAYIYENIGNVKDAVKCCEKHLEVYPDTISVKIRLAFLYARRGKKERVKKILNFKEDIISYDFDIKLLFRIANLLALINKFKEAIELAYQIRKKYYYVGEAHNLYMGTLISIEKSKKPNKPKKVAINTAVKLINEQGVEKAYTIVDSENLIGAEIKIESPLAKVLIGKKTGEIIEIDRNYGEPEKLTISQILNKYAFAFQESLDLIQNKFIEIKNFKSFRLTNTGDRRRDLSAFFSELDKLEQHQENIAEIYSNTLFPISALAQLRDENIIRTWGGMVSNPKFGIFCNGRLTNDTPNTKEILQSGAGIVIELTSLLTLNSIGQLALLSHIDNKKYVAQTLIDEINEHIFELEGYGDEDLLTVGKVNGEYVKDITPASRIKSVISSYRELTFWLKQNCEVTYSKELLSMTRQERDRRYKVLGNSLLDTFFIAKEKDCLLYADEEANRSLAYNEYKVRGISLLNLLELHIDSGRIDAKQYDQIKEKLITNYFYKFLPVSAKNLYSFLEKAEYKIQFPFDYVLQTSLTEANPWQQLARVIIEFFYILYLRVPENGLKTTVVLTVLVRISKHPNFNFIVLGMLRIIENSVALTQLQKQHLLTIIKCYIAELR